MSKENYIQIEATIQKKNPLMGIDKEILVKVICKFQYAVAWFSDKKLAKKLTKAEKASGKDVRYDPKLNVMVERFTGKTANEVAEIVGKQMKAQGGTLK